MSLKSIGEVSLSQMNSVSSILDKNCFINKLSASSQSATSAAYSIRLLNTNYKGPMVRVRRGADNVEKDFYGDLEGNLGTQRYANGDSISSWLGGSTGYVRTWYDQNGNGRHVEQTTAANQPSIYGTPLLDKLSPEARTGARGIYALYRASTTYTGATIRIRRSTDSVEADFYANAAGTLGTALDGTGTSITSWLGAATAFVRTWYDQSGGGRHATQTTTSAQPVLNISSLLIDFQNDSARFLNIPSGTVPVGTLNAPYTFVTQHGTVNNTSIGGIIGSGTSGAGNENKSNNFNLAIRDSRAYLNWWNGNDYYHGATTDVAAGNKVSIKYDGTNRQGYINGTHYTAQTSSGYTNAAAQQFIGRNDFNSNFLNGQLYFVYIFGTSLADNDRILCENTRTTDIIPKINYRGAQWLSLTNTQVPSAAMTSNSSGGFIASASTELSDSEAYKAFNLNSTDFWHSEYLTPQYNQSSGVYIGSVSTIDTTGTIHMGEWLQIQCPSAINLNAFSIVPRSTWESTRSPVDFVVLGSNNGTSWVLLDEEENIKWTGERLFTISRTVESYNYYRLVIKKVGLEIFGVASVQIAEFKLNPKTTPLSAGEKTYSIFANWNSNTVSNTSSIVEQVTVNSNNSRACIYRSGSRYGFSGWANDLLQLVNFTAGLDNKSIMVVNDALNPNITMYHNGFVHQGASGTPGSLSAGTGEFSIGRRPDNTEYFNGTINEIIVISHPVRNTDAMIYYTPNDNSIKSKPIPTPKIQLDFSPFDGEKLRANNDTLAKVACNISSLNLLPDTTAVANWNGFVQNTPANRPTYYKRFGYRNDFGSIAFRRANSQHLTLGSTTFNATTNGGFTATVLVRFTGTGSDYERIFDFGNGQGSDNLVFYRNGLGSSGTIAFTYLNGGTGYYIDVANSIVQEEWAVFSARHNTTTRLTELFKNGVLIGSATLGAAMTNRTTSTNYIGRSNWSGEPYPNIDIGGLYVFDRFLSDNELANLNKMMMYNSISNQSQLVTDYNNNLSNKLFYSKTIPGSLGYSANFDGTGSCFYDLQEVPSLPMTFCFWVNTPITSNQEICGLNDLSRSNGGIAVQFVNGLFCIYSWDGSAWITVSNTIGFSANTWYHIAITINSNGSVQFYLNGTLRNTVTALPARRSRFIIGAAGHYDSLGLNGSIYDFRVYDCILRADQISLINGDGRNNIRPRQNTLLPPQNYLVNHSNWHLKMKINQTTGSFTPTVADTGNNVQYRLLNSTQFIGNHFYGMDRIQDFESFEFSFEIYTENANGDALWFLCGSTAFGNESTTNSGFHLAFHLSGDKLISVRDNSSTQVGLSYYSEWANASKWVPVVVKYRRNVVDTWIINVGGQDVITYSNPNNESWISSSGSLWGIGARSGADTMSCYIRRLQLTYQPYQKSNLSISTIRSNNALTKFPDVALTSNTSNGYIVSASSNITDWEAFKAFDSDSATGWHCTDLRYNSSTGVYTGAVSTTDTNGTVHSGEWLQLFCPSSIKLKSFSIAPRQGVTSYDRRSPRSFVVLGSNNGTTWNLIFTETNSNNWLNATKTFTITNPNIPPYAFFRIVTKRVGNSNSGMSTATSVQIMSLELYGDSFTSHIKYPYVNLLENSDRSGFTASASTAFDVNRSAFKAFDSSTGEFTYASASTYNATTGAYSGSVTTNVSGVNYLGEWLQLQMPSTTTISHYSITCRADFETRQSPNTWVLAGSNNGSTWNLIESRSSISNWTATLRTQTFYLTSPVSYSYYRVVCTVTGYSTSSRTNFSVSDLSFYGEPYTTFAYPHLNLTSNSDSGYTASSSTLYSAPYAAFDGTTSGDNGFAPALTYNTTTGAYAGSVSTNVSGITYSGEWLQIQMPNVTNVNSYTMTCSESNPTTRSLNTWILAGSNNGITWDLIDSRSNVSNWSSSLRIQTFYLNKTVSYSYYRIIGTITGQVASADRNTFVITELKFYGGNANELSVRTIAPTNNALPSSGLIQGLTWKYFDGDFSGDMINNFINTPWREIGITNNLTNLSSATNSFFLTDAGDNWSCEWTGYFRPNVSGVWTFNLYTDNYGYLWVGNTALNGYTTSNGLINGIDFNAQFTPTSASIYLTAGVYYPIRIRFTESTGGNEVRFSFTSPYAVTSFDGTGFFFSSVGTNSAFPAESAKVIKAISYTNTDGIYHINSNGVSTPVYCLMNDHYDGGGWMMLMKATRGTTFNGSANYWSTANTLNPTETNRNDGDAKFNVFNYNPIKDVMAIFPDISSTAPNVGGLRGGSLDLEDGWCWKVNNWNSTTRTTALAGFQNSRDAHPSDPNQFSGFSTSVFSHQTVSRRHVFGGGSHLSTNRSVRWGLLFNNAAGFTSVNSGCGIGFSNLLSAGDWTDGNDSSVVRLNRTARVELYGRD